MRCVQVVAPLSMYSFSNVHRYFLCAELQRVLGETMIRLALDVSTLVSFLVRLLAAFGEREGAAAAGGGGGEKPRASAQELDRLVAVAMAVIQEEAKAR